MELKENFSINKFHDIVIAILAKDKGFSLPFYLKCIFNQTYPKKYTHIYIRTNDNKDDTVDILKQFISCYGHMYASIFIDETSISEKLKKFGHHEWNSERFKILGKIRQESVDHAIKLDAHYFVADCDNFIVPNTIEEMWKNSHNGVLCPMLKSNRLYSNFHVDVDENGYYKHNDIYHQYLNATIKGLIELSVVHCTYFIHNKFLKDVSYDDNSYRYEYVVFSDVLRKKIYLKF